MIKLDFITNPMLEIKDYKLLIDKIKKNKFPLHLNGPVDSQKLHLLLSIFHHTKKKIVYVTHNEFYAKRSFDEVNNFFEEGVLFFPSRDITYYDIEAKSYENVHQRQNVLDKILRDDFKIIVTSGEALINKLISPKKFIKNCLKLELGKSYNINEILNKLVQMDYERSQIVEGKGQFSLRGGILDVFGINLENPVRIEFFDEEIDSIRIFDNFTQRSNDSIKFVEILPAKDIIFDFENQDNIVRNIRNDLQEYTSKIKESKLKSDLISKIENDIEKIENRAYFAGVDKYIPYLQEEYYNFLDYIDKDTIVIVDEKSKIRDRISSIDYEHNEMVGTLLKKGVILPKTIESTYNKEEFLEILDESKTLYISIFNDINFHNKNSGLKLISKTFTDFHGNLDLVCEEIKYQKSQKSRVFLSANSEIMGKRLIEILKDKEIESNYIEDLNRDIEKGEIIISPIGFSTGFTYPEIGFTIIGERGFGYTKKARSSKDKVQGKKITDFSDLKIGDIVVHRMHGIGEYIGIETLLVENVKKDYFKVRYQDDGYIYIPTTQMDLIQKYIGSEGNAPKLNKLGTSDWIKAKRKVKAAVKEVAEELVKLYAEREKAVGYSFSPDSIWQRQFEEMFPYQETNDQLRCIEEVKGDMEKTRPMDRLLCGDVGYGKTEVALRAAFKAINDGKQVAYLVPTTILAQQQWKTFSERMSQFPVNVEVVSRFRSKNDQSSVLKGVKSGMVDILVGTHRLLQKDVIFKNLGLLIIDEEQRFGVAHKEKLKRLKPNVDVLTLSATPIPRTLHMSLVGIRDISTISEPPQERLPVQTYVMEYDDDIISDAIHREMARNGQIFYLYNRVETIDKKVTDLKNLVPDARVIAAHGRMDEKKLEDIMTKFLEQKYDVLVCTTIIESGLDMPNVNTIIVEDADKMGLSQLYQLRGRVGRSSRKAYAYITHKRDKVISDVAQKRLAAIKEFTEFGSGFKIALKDLEIRGSGNLLGSQQHGQMEAVGYDLYLRLLEEAVKEANGQSAIEEESLDISIDLSISAYIDENYISDQVQKIDIYKRIACIISEEDVLDIRDELTDRFGDIPKIVDNLIKIAFLKQLAKESGFKSITEKKGGIYFYFNKKTFDVTIIGEAFKLFSGKLFLDAGAQPCIIFKISDLKDKEKLENIKVLLHSISKLKKNNK